MKTDYEIVTMNATERQMWRHPLTSIFTFLLAASFAGGLVYTFAFTDTTRQLVEHALHSLAVFVALGLLLALIKKREDKGILPRWIRRAIWLGIIGAYVATAVLLFAIPGGDRLKAFSISMKLGALGVIPFFAWRLLKDKEA